MATEDQLQALTEMVLVMRADSGGEHGVQSKDLQNVLFGIRD